MGRRKGGCNKSGGPVLALDFDIPYHDCPTVRKVATSNEMHLFDLASVQTELECMVVDVIERTACLTAELNDTEIPPNIRKALCHKESCADADVPHTSTNKSSLVVKANPEKPLTLIISQRSRYQQSHTSYPPPAPEPADVSSVRSKAAPQGSSSRRNRPVNQNPSSPPETTGQSTSSYVVPNKFWELMEPYCAEITESNINYLEELLRAYQDMDSAYFELPPVQDSELSRQPEPLSPAAKRVRRDTATTAAGVSSPSSRQTGDHGHSQRPTTKVGAGGTSSSSSDQLARCLELELRRPVSESTSIGRLSQSLLSSCYQENIVFSFTDSCAHLTDSIGEPHPTGSGHKDVAGGQETVGHHPGQTSTTSQTRVPPPPSLPSADEQPTLSFPRSLSSNLTSRASQPLKNIAKQLHVNSSFRVEKKISQVMDELGLFPLNLVHLPPPATSRTRLEDGEDCPATSTDAAAARGTSPTKAYYARLLASLNAEQAAAGTREVEDSAEDDPLHHLSRMEVVAGAKRRSGVSCLRSPLRSRRCKDRHLVDEFGGGGVVASEEGEEQHQLEQLHQLSGVQPCPSDADGASGDKSTNPSGDRTEVNGGPSPFRPAELAGGRRSTSLAASQRQTCHLKRLKKLKLAGRHRKRMRRAAPAVDPSSGRLGSLHKATLSKATVQSPELGELPLVNGSVLTEDETSREACGKPVEAEVFGPDPGQQLPSSPPRGNSNNSIFERFRSRLLLDSPTSPPVLASEARGSSGDTQQQHQLLSPPGEGGAPATGGDEGEEDEVRELSTTTVANGLGHEARLGAGTVQLERSEDNSGSASDSYQEAVSGLQEQELGLSPVHSVGCAPEAEATTTVENKFFPDCLEPPPPHRVSWRTSPRCLPSSPPPLQEPGDCQMDEVSLAILQRQQELRLVCASNHSLLRRLLQAAKRDVQRQEIQRRLAIADADVIEAYNKLESYRPQRKPPLKRDRDAAHKALKERRKILKELEAFDAKSP